MLRRILIGLGLVFALAVAGCSWPSHSNDQSAAKAARAAARAQVTAAVQAQNRQVYGGNEAFSFKAGDQSRGTVDIYRVGQYHGMADFQRRPDGTWAVGCTDTAANTVIDFGDDGAMAANWNIAGACPPAYRKGAVPAVPAPTTAGQDQSPN